MTWSKSFVHRRTGQQSPSLRPLYRACTPEERAFAADFFERYPTGQGIGTLTPFAGLRANPGPLAGLPPQRRPLDQALLEALQPHLRQATVAVSGGIDSWVLAALLKSHGCDVQAWYLESGVPGYCERDRVHCFSRALNIPVQSIQVQAQDFIDNAPAFVRATDFPIYNLHPVSKLLFAQAFAGRTVITGDGADQVMHGAHDCDLLPLTLSCFQAANVNLILPFLEGVTREPQPDKAPIRALAARLGLPQLPKNPTYFPDIQLPKGQTCLAYTTDLLCAALQE
jgi:asparagine synthetase B (glutamine-hydrolysing)